MNALSVAIYPNAEWPTSENLHTQLDCKRYRAEGIPELQAMITFRGFREALKFAACGPVELPRVDHDASNRRTMATNPFSRAVDHNIGPQINRADKISTYTAN